MTASGRMTTSLVVTHDSNENWELVTGSGVFVLFYVLHVNVQTELTL